MAAALQQLIGRANNETCSRNGLAADMYPERVELGRYLVRFLVHGDEGFLKGLHARFGGVGRTGKSIGRFPSLPVSFLTLLGTQTCLASVQVSLSKGMLFLQCLLMSGPNSIAHRPCHVQAQQNARKAGVAAHVIVPHQQG